MGDSVQGNICFIGSGSMAEAILRGMLERQIVEPGQITVTNRQNRVRLEQLQSQYGVNAAFDAEHREQAVKEASLLLLAVKPKDAEAALASIRHCMHQEQLLVSVLAGVSIASLQRFAGMELPVIRTMPNTSSTIGLGATGISLSPSVTASQKAQSLAVFNAIGIVKIVEEDQLHLVTALSGSGPAYIYLMMEAMMEAAVSSGMEEATAKELTVQTFLGAAQMVERTGEEPAVLREKVTSPGGTTFAALEQFRKLGFKEMVKQAMDSAAARSREMGAAMESAKGGSA
ncbi:pyrroline-5-carboxylate reductase [Xylanibacillus composti]|uniref:Pyrroline-5-carboxylate reductase n=1 Tax=Xylanibacillus composti TaxID=1572762 RepID=A0A8J4H2W8_9BACL|nr:pyrroline-5-carboxylate reductase [Xylanibacillus composti]MDT9725514.1 pyrroline-5-carboxylate reductase [Xylanibacillus composti]GIQ67608.1 pyrroline-5-carboxylate reductase [Xylanibacillus composti]